MSCSQESKVLYQNQEFTLFEDRVVQGENVAEVISPTHLKSNYKSPASETYSRLIQFKFSINEKDNELPVGQNHWVVIGEETSTLIEFGKTPEAVPEESGTFLETNRSYTFQLDASSVLKQFEDQGYYEAFDGSRIAKEDFKGFYLAGGSEPMTWDFVNLDLQGLKMQPTEDPNIYQLTLTLNPFDPEDYKEKEWKPTVDVSAKPTYRSDQPIVDALFNLSLEEAILNIEPDSTLRTGAKWGGVWTRDVSYSILLAFAYHEPEVAKISLRRKVKRNRIIQDTGSGGAWPVSSDRTTWSLAAWEIYKTTGDQAWLREAYQVIKNTLDDDIKVLRSETTGMYRGESSFLDWREQTYPKWMSNMDIYVSENLGTNVVHYQAHVILVEMAKILGEPFEEYENRAQEIKRGINEYLWMDDKGYYAQFVYGRSSLNLSPRYEALGEALAILFDVADEEQANSIIAKSPLTAFGATCIYPQIPGIPPYHNNGIWPFVQSYWNLAAAKAGNEEVLTHGLAAIYRAAGLFLTNYENFVAESGDFLGTEINSHRMLWSMAGNLAMVHRVFMGISFERDGIRFQPVVPQVYAGVKTLSNFKYRDAVLNITVEGFGNEISSVFLDGTEAEEAFLPADLSGTHEVKITLSNKSFGEGINLVENRFTLPTPLTSLSGSILSWEPIEGAMQYRLYKDGDLMEEMTTNKYEITDDGVAEFKVTAVDGAGYESFSSEPITFMGKTEVMQQELEKHARKADYPYINYTGNGFIEVSNAENRVVEVPVNASAEGTYLMDLRYSNGTGPWNTDNNCAIRSLYVNDEYVGSLVFPQRGTDEWSDWGFSNSYKVKLRQGENLIRLQFDDWNINMDVEINQAMLDHIRLIKL